MCSSCVKAHKLLKQFASHEVVSLQDKSQMKLIKDVQNCDIHYDEPLVIYCFDCNQLVCRDCILKDHKDHKCEFCKVEANNQRSEIKGELKCLVEVLDTMRSVARNIEKTEGEIESQGASVLEIIQTSFNELKDILEKHKQALLEKVNTSLAKKRKIISIQKNVIESSCKDIEGVINSTEQKLSDYSDNELVSQYVEVRKNIQQGIERHGKVSSNTAKPREKADIGVEVKCSKELQLLLQTKARITRLLVVDTPLGSVQGEGTETAVVNQEAEVTLTTSQQLIRANVEVVGELKSLFDGSVVKCEADQSGPGKYRIRYTPTVRGRHELSVSIDGKEMGKDPFSVFVTIPPTELKKPIQVWTDISRASGVAISHEGDPIITEYFGSIKLIQQQKHVPIVTQESARLNSLCGIATDEKGNIYCTDAETNSIMVYNSAEDKVDTYPLKQQKGPGHWGIALVGRDRVMLCECNNKGSFMVYNRRWKYDTCVEQGSGQFMDISSDSSSNVYVTDYVSASILVFNKELSFVRSFGSGGRRGRELIKPYGLCVSDSYLYISNWGSSHNVTVFTLDGKFISSFGRRGGEEGNFDSPCGVCVDKDGFVIVADYGNNRVQSF